MRFLISLLVCLSATIAAHAVTLVEKGKPVARIYVVGPLENTAMTGAAARKLSPEVQAQRAMVEIRGSLVADFNYHVEKMTGTKLEVLMTDDPATVRGPAVVIGELAVKLGAKPAHQTPLKESYTPRALA